MDLTPRRQGAKGKGSKESLAAFAAFREIFVPIGELSLVSPAMKIK